MVKENIILCVDNSEYMRNGDYSPTRMEAQTSALNLICGARTQNNPETQVGILTMAGKTPIVHVSLTTNLGKLLNCLNSIPIFGKINFSNSIKVALLALKRRTTDQSQQCARRIISFIGSPIIETQEEIQNLALNLKKNNISIDVVNFCGESDAYVGNSTKLDSFINTINSNNGEKLSTYINVTLGPHILSNILLGTSLFPSDGGRNTSSGSGFGDEFGAEDDPELQMVLRMSAEEERKRLEKQKKGYFFFYYYNNNNIIIIIINNKI